MTIREWEELMEREFDLDGTIPFFCALRRVAQARHDEWDRPAAYGHEPSSGHAAVAARWADIVAWCNSRLATGD